MPEAGGGATGAHGRWPSRDVPPDLRAHVVRPAPPLPPALEATVARHWQAAVAETPALFNGRVFSVDRIRPALLEGHWTEYRRALAQIREPALRRTLRVRPLAVCGAVLCSGGVVIGRRSPDAVYQAGLWQLPPAGSVDDTGAGPDGAVDLHAQFLRELREELGLDPAALDTLRPVCLVQHPGSGVLDLGFVATTGLPGAAVLAAHAAGGNDEYRLVQVVPLTELPAMLRGERDALAPQSRALLRRIVPRAPRHGSARTVAANSG